ncbi:uncharacterized protein LOC119069918 [Bradysia coprophila]|uniref:uncharacterized protein LOC119069918 n=1 Tax=Bradysia coprophila TaxID=38358 RepID=UPI00187D9D58|nr:uncharacterized protein LOC119069918 [Bradysia coprophila]
MVLLFGLRLLVVLAVVHATLTQQIGILNRQLAYRDIEQRSFNENVRLASYRSQMQQPQLQQTEPTETRIIKHPDEKIVHHPSPIYVKRPPTFVTINHPDIVIEPHPVVYHKPAAVVRSPVVYKHLPRKIQYRNMVKHLVKPIEQKIVLEEKRPPKIYARHSQPQYFVAQQLDASPAATENVPCQHINRMRLTGQLVYQPSAISSYEGEDMNDAQHVPPLDIARVYYRQNFPTNYRQ